MDKISLRIATPYTLTTPSGGNGAALADIPTDGYAGSVAADETMQRIQGATAAPAEEAKPAHRGRAIFFAALATIGVIGAIAARSANAMPPVQDATSVSQTIDFKLSNPTRPMPDNVDVDAATWSANATKAFDAYSKGDVNGLLEQTSEDGVWVRGLPGSNGTTYMTKAEFTRDLQHKGPFQQHVFGQHGNERFVISPDAQGHVQTILLD